MAQQRERLPVFKLRKEILYLLEKFQTVIVVGETGSGKTTRKSILHSVWGMFLSKCLDRNPAVSNGIWLGKRRKTNCLYTSNEAELSMLKQKKKEKEKGLT